MGSSHITIDPLPLVIFTIGELTVHFSENPKEPIGFFETILFTHQPTCDDCQQLLQLLFTTEERDGIQTEAWRLVLGPSGEPTANQALIDAPFPLIHRVWD